MNALSLLTSTRLDAGKVEPSYDVVDVEALVKQAVGMMAARARVKSINLTISKSGNPPLYLKADGTILSQVFLNLISNAIKVSSMLASDFSVLTK